MNNKIAFLIIFAFSWRSLLVTGRLHFGMDHEDDDGDDDNNQEQLLMTTLFVDKCVGANFTIYVTPIDECYSGKDCHCLVRNKNT